MTDPGDITVEIPRSPKRESDGARHTTEEDSSQRVDTKRRRSKKRRNTNDSNNLKNSVSEEDPGREPERGEAVTDNGNRGDGQKRDTRSTPEDIRSRFRFYEDYRKVAEEYDREFNKRYDDDLNTSLIFAGLFSAVTSAFIIEVNSQLQQDPSEETAALLRVIIHMMNNSALDGIPTVPKWSGPPRSIIQVQAMLYASLAVSLFSAFLAMLGKQWLNRYAFADMCGTAIERGQGRQRKLNGIVSWHFGHVMESLPLMLQVALLLLGCALSRYLWETNTTIASVVISVTSFGVLFYLFILVASTASESCPYQAPGSHGLRSAASTIASATLAIASVLRRTAKRSETVHMLRSKVRRFEPWWSKDNVTASLKTIPYKLPGALAVDTFRVGRMMVHLLVAPARRAYTQLFYSSSTPGNGLDQQTILWDLRCISWTLKTSLDRVVHLSSLESLATMATLADFDPTLVVDCFNILISSVKVIDNTVVVTQGSEQLATSSAMCLLRTFSHLSVMDPTSSVLGDVRQRYDVVFPPNTDFKGFPFHHTLGAIHSAFYPDWKHPWFDWEDHKPSNHEHAIFAHALADLARSEYYRRMHDKKVPGWILRFVLHSLSSVPIPSASVIIDCLSIIAIDLGCDVSTTGTTVSDESTRVDQVSTMISQMLETMVKAADPVLICDRYKAITAFFPYAARQVRGGQDKMFNTFLRTARASKRRGFMWHRVRPPVATLLSEESPVSLKQAIIFAVPHLPWWDNTIDGDFVRLWAAAALAVPYSRDIGQCVVDTLLLIASQESLRPHVPVDMWSWLNKRPLLPPTCTGGPRGTEPDVVQAVRGLRDVEVLTSYLLVVWSEWVCIYVGGLEEMCASIREDFSGIGMVDRRKDLLRRLDHILDQLDLGLEPILQHEQGLGEDDIRSMKDQYKRLKEVLLEVDRGVTT